MVQKQMQLVEEMEMVELVQAVEAVAEVEEESEESHWTSSYQIRMMSWAISVYNTGY